MLAGEIAALAVADIAIISVLLDRTNVDRSTLRGLFSAMSEQNSEIMQPVLRRLTAKSIARHKPKRLEKTYCRACLKRL